MANHSGHSVVVMDTYHIRIEARDSFIFRPFVMPRELYIMDQPFQIGFDFLKGLFFYMALDYKFWFLCAAVIRCLDFQPQELRICLFQIHNP